MKKVFLFLWDLTNEESERVQLTERVRVVERVKTSAQSIDRLRTKLAKMRSVRMTSVQMMLARVMSAKTTFVSFLICYEYSTSDSSLDRSMVLIVLWSVQKTTSVRCRIQIDQAQKISWSEYCLRRELFLWDHLWETYFEENYLK